MTGQQAESTSISPQAWSVKLASFLALSIAGQFGDDCICKKMWVFMTFALQACQTNQSEAQTEGDDMLRAKMRKCTDKMLGTATQECMDTSVALQVLAAKW